MSNTNENRKHNHRVCMVLVFKKKKCLKIHFHGELHKFRLITVECFYTNYHISHFVGFLNETWHVSCLRKKLITCHSVLLIKDIISINWLRNTNILSEANGLLPSDTFYLSHTWKSKWNIIRCTVWKMLKLWHSCFEVL